MPAEQEAAARQLVAAMSPNARLTYSVGGTLKFELPTAEVSAAQTQLLESRVVLADVAALHRPAAWPSLAVLCPARRLHGMKFMLRLHEA